MSEFTRFCIYPSTGIVVREIISEDILTNGDEFLKEQLLMKIPQVLSFPGLEPDSGMVYAPPAPEVTGSTHQYAIWKRIQKFDVRTWFSPTSTLEQLQFLPIFERTAATVDLTRTYTIPDGLAAYFIWAYSNPENLWDGGTGFLVYRDMATNILYHPGLPNIHANCALCTGSLPVATSVRSSGLWSLFEAIREVWGNNSWNTDLIALFVPGIYKWDAQGKQIDIPREVLISSLRHVLPPEIVQKTINCAIEQEG